MINSRVVDDCVGHVDRVLRTLFGTPLATDRNSPVENEPEPELSKQEKRHVAGLMRVNHAGEVAAQALYQGHALTAKDSKTRLQMEQAALEENDHLVWCEQRLQELGSHKSYLNPVWYTGSLLIGIIAGIAGDRYSLGFVEETEHQVISHLQSHLDDLPPQDHKTRKIIEQMHVDEAQHAETAHNAGAKELPKAVKTLMGYVAKVMTFSAYRL